MVFALGVRLLGAKVEHGGQRGAVDIAVHQADGRAFAGQTDGQVDGDGGFADPALAGADGDDVLDAGQGVVLLAGVVLRGSNLSGELNLGLGDRRPDCLGLAGHRLLHIALDDILERAGRRREVDDDLGGPLQHLGFLHHPQRHQVAVQFRIVDGRQSFDEVVVGEGHGLLRSTFLGVAGRWAAPSRKPPRKGWMIG